MIGTCSRERVCIVSVISSPPPHQKTKSQSLHTPIFPHASQDFLGEDSSPSRKFTQALTTCPLFRREKLNPPSTKKREPEGRERKIPPLGMAVVPSWYPSSRTCLGNTTLERPDIGTSLFRANMYCGVRQQKRDTAPVIGDWVNGELGLGLGYERARW